MFGYRKIGEFKSHNWTPDLTHFECICHDNRVEENFHYEY